MRFIHGHYGKVQPVGSAARQWRGGRRLVLGRWLVHAPEHPRRNGAGYVFEHVLIAGDALGRPVPRSAEVHHVNGETGDNRRANLVVCEDRTYHALLHVRTRALRATGDADKRRCSLCKEYDHVGDLRRRWGQNVFVHPACQRAYRNAYYRRAGA